MELPRVGTATLLTRQPCQSIRRRRVKGPAPGQAEDCSPCPLSVVYRARVIKGSEGPQTMCSWCELHVVTSIAEPPWDARLHDTWIAACYDLDRWSGKAGTPRSPTWVSRTHLAPFSQAPALSLPRSPS